MVVFMIELKIKIDVKKWNLIKNVNKKIIYCKNYLFC